MTQFKKPKFKIGEVVIARYYQYHTIGEIEIMTQNGDTEWVYTFRGGTTPYKESELKLF